MVLAADRVRVRANTLHTVHTFSMRCASRMSTCPCLIEIAHNPLWSTCKRGIVVTELDSSEMIGV